MLERFIQVVRTDDPGAEMPAATRERLKARFAPGAVRRMTQLGMLVGALLADVQPGADDAVVYASEFGESRALEGYLESFPAASPTLFQTSIHPSAVQQALIARQQPMRELLPTAGGPQLVGHAVLAALLAPAERAILCGGEERGTWLLDHAAASDRTFAFALLLTRNRPSGPVGRIAVAPSTEAATALSLPAWFDLLHGRSAFSATVAPGWRLTLEWT